MFETEFTDREGIRRRVRLPEAGLDPAEGIPLSLPVDRLYAHMPASFQAALVDALWAQGLIVPADFLTASAPGRIRSALLTVVKHDVFSIQAFAKEYQR